MSGSFPHTFTVTCPTKEGEIVAVTGSSLDLGQWRRHAILPMVRDQGDTWSVAVDLSDDVTHQYRYCVVVMLQQQQQKKIIVRKWETHLKPRLHIT